MMKISSVSDANECEQYFYNVNCNKDTGKKYTGCTQCATPKLPKKVLHIGDIALKNRDEIFGKK